MITTQPPSWFRLLMLLVLGNNVSAFQRTTPLPTRLNAGIFLAKRKGDPSGKSKGFGEAVAPKKPSSKETPSKNFTPMAVKPSAKQMEGTPALPNTLNTQLDSPRTEDRPDASDMNQGKIALERMRRVQAEKKDAELRRVKEIRETDKLLQSSPEAAAIPERVAMRMGKRMLPFVGIPLFGSMGAFVAFWYFATYKNMEFQPGMVASITIAILASGLLGITYSIVSASWDEDREGSLLGIEEFQKNVDSIKEGLERSKENLVLRGKMAGLPEEEIEAAIAELERREKRKQESIESKMKELEEK